MMREQKSFTKTVKLLPKEEILRTSVKFQTFFRINFTNIVLKNRCQRF